MSLYTIAALTKTDDAEYAEYVKLAIETLRKYPHARVAADDQPKLLEGTLPAERWVILQWDNEEDFYDWYNSPEYRAAMTHRLKSSQISFKVMIKGHGHQ